MIFKDFGDADAYRSIGKEASEFIISGGSYFQYVNESTSIRPLGAIFYNSLPYLISDDPIVQSNLYFLMNLFFYFIGIFGLVNILKILNKEDNDLFNVFFATLTITLFYFSHLSILAMDIQPLSLTLWALYFLLKVINNISGGLKLSYKDLFLLLNLISLAGLLKQSWFVYGFGFMCISGLFQLNKEQIISIFKDKYFWIILIFGTWGFWLQCYYIYVHFGDFWIIKKDGLDYYSAAWVYPNLALFAYTEPNINAYLLHSEQDTSYIVWFLQKLYISLFYFDFSIYKGFAPHIDTTFYTPIPSIIIVCFSLIVVFSILFYGIKQNKNKTYRFLSIFSMLLIFYSNYKTHVEIRVFMFPKILLVIIGFELFNSLISSYFKNNYLKSIKYFFVMFAFVYWVNCFIDKNNYSIIFSKISSYYKEQQTYIEKQLEYLDNQGINYIKKEIYFENINCLANNLYIVKLNDAHNCINILKKSIAKNQVIINEYQILVLNKVLSYYNEQRNYIQKQLDFLNYEKVSYQKKETNFNIDDCNGNTSLNLKFDEIQNCINKIQKEIFNNQQIIDYYQQIIDNK